MSRGCREANCRRSASGTPSRADALNPGLRTVPPRLDAWTCRVKPVCVMLALNRVLSNISGQKFSQFAKYKAKIAQKGRMPPLPVE